MGESLRELRDLVKFCRKNGIFKIKTAQFEVEIAKEALKPTKARQEAAGISIPSIPSWDSFTLEEQLTYSSKLPGT